MNKPERLSLTINLDLVNMKQTIREKHGRPFVAKVGNRVRQYSGAEEEC